MALRLGKPAHGALHHLPNLRPQGVTPCLVGHFETRLITPTVRADIGEFGAVLFMHVPAERSELGGLAPLIALDPIGSLLGSLTNRQ